MLTKPAHKSPTADIIMPAGTLTFWHLVASLMQRIMSIHLSNCLVWPHLRTKMMSLLRSNKMGDTHLQMREE